MNVSAGLRKDLVLASAVPIYAKNEGYYCFPEGQHLIFYPIHKHRIDVIGVPHKAMDILDYFDI